VRDPEVWRDALVGVGHALVAQGAAIMGAMTSPLRGADGNVEFFLHARTDDARTLGDDALDVVVDRAHTGALP
jgi:predicted rRNA methylase YqxC with S4 and FtsJ domains